MPTTMMTRRLSDLLLLQGLVSADDLGRATDEQQSTGESLPDVLLRLKVLSAPQVYRVLADHLTLEYINLAEHQVDPTAVGLIPEAMARRHTMLPIGFTDEGSLVVAMSDPSNVLAIDDVRNVSDLDIRPVVATPEDLASAIDRYFRMGDAVNDAFEGVADEDDDDLAALTGAAQDAPVVKFVNALIAQGVQDRASDLHFEPQEHDFRVRYRVDGVLHEVTRQRRSIHAGVVSRIKIMAGLDIAERRVPQDGRVRREPDAVEAARPVRRAGRGNPHDESRAGRSGPTLHALHPGRRGHDRHRGPGLAQVDRRHRLGRGNLHEGRDRLRVIAAREVAVPPGH